MIPRLYTEAERTYISAQKEFSLLYAKIDELQASRVHVGVMMFLFGNIVGAMVCYWLI